MFETRAAMRVHFVHRHVHDTVVRLEEGNLPLPWCPRCDLQVSSKALNGRHLEMNQCRMGAETKIRRLAAAEGEAATKRAFHAYGRRMQSVTEFRYLGYLVSHILVRNTWVRPTQMAAALDAFQVRVARRLTG